MYIFLLSDNDTNILVFPSTAERIIRWRNDLLRSQNMPLPPVRGYEHIPYPTIEQLRRAAYNWHCIAQQYRLEYAFVGSIVARFRGDDFEVHTIEILVRPSTLDDNARILTQIKNQRPRISRHYTNE